MAWISVFHFNIGAKRTDAILIPFLLDASHIAIKVRQPALNKWVKAGDLWQQFTGGVKGVSQFVRFDEQTAIAMDNSLGKYYLRFQPVPYHKGLSVQIWRWVANAFGAFWFDDGAWDDLEVWQ
jgi:hypothetical protein